MAKADMPEVIKILNKLIKEPTTVEILTKAADSVHRALDEERITPEEFKTCMRILGPVRARLKGTV